MMKIYVEAMRDPYAYTKDKLYMTYWYLFKYPFYLAKNIFKLAKTGCLINHKWDYIVVEYEDIELFTEVCTRCKEVSGVIFPSSRNTNG